MNRNEYRRALIMLRSLRSGISGYVRLERRTLMGTLQFTVNGVAAGGELHAVLLYRNNGGYSGVRLDKFAAPRYGQTGIVWKFDPRNIENRTLEQYDLAAVIEISSGICELLLCGNLNGSVEADWNQVRDAACRLFSPVRISGAPISPIEEKKHDDSTQNHHEIQTLPEYSEEIPAYPEGSDTPPEPDTPKDNDIARKTSPHDAFLSEETEEAESCGCSFSDEPAETEDRFDMPAAERKFRTIMQMEAALEPDEFDMPAQDEALSRPAHPLQSSSAEENTVQMADELDTPAQDDFSVESTAGEQLNLKNPDAAWPSSVEPLRPIFFSSEAIAPLFEMENYVFIRAPLAGETGAESCYVGIKCSNGRPAHVCYAIPAPYSPEPPVGLEGYVWQGTRSGGCWVVCEDISDE